MRKAIQYGLCLSLVVLCIACGNENDDLEAMKAVIKYEEALHEHDGVALKEVAMDLEDAGELASVLGFKLGKKKAVEEPNYGYEMKEYKRSEIERYFEVHWYSRDGSRSRKAYFVAFEGEKWKVFGITLIDLAPETKGLQPKIHKELAQ